MTFTEFTKQYVDKHRLNTQTTISSMGSVIGCEYVESLVIAGYLLEHGNSQELVAEIQEGTKDRFLQSMAHMIMRYEDPTGCNCANNVSCKIQINDKSFLFDGGKFREGS